MNLDNDWEHAKNYCFPFELRLMIAEVDIQAFCLMRLAFEDIRIYTEKHAEYYRKSYLHLVEKYADQGHISESYCALPSGLKMGNYCSYHSNGYPKIICRYVSDHISNERLYGDYIEYAINGQIIDSASYNYEGRLHYIHRQYYDNGNSKTVSNIKDGVIHGNYRSYYEDGTSHITTKYKDGHKHKSYKESFGDGSISIDCCYYKGKLHGPYIQYFDMSIYPDIDMKKFSPQIYIECYHENDVFHGSRKIYKRMINKDSRAFIRRFLYIESQYQHGVINGVCRQYHNNGKINIQCNYQNGNLNGGYEEYLENGQQIIECSYKDDVKHGLYKEWYANTENKNKPQIKSMGYYSKGVKDGAWDEWYQSGVKHKEYYYSLGRIHGKNYLWSVIGQLKSEREYVYGKKHGIHRVWYHHDQDNIVKTKQNGVKLNFKVFEPSSNLDTNVDDDQSIHLYENFLCDIDEEIDEQNNSISIVRNANNVLTLCYPDMDEDNTKKLHIQCNYQTEHSPCALYTQNTKLKCYISYENDIFCGPEIFWDCDGTLSKFKLHNVS